MRGINDGYKVMQPLMASRGDKSGADQQERPHHGFESLKRGWRSDIAISANAPTHINGMHGLRRRPTVFRPGAAHQW
jgi:hypothetical protein